MARFLSRVKTNQVWCREGTLISEQEFCIGPKWHNTYEADDENFDDKLLMFVNIIMIMIMIFIFHHTSLK